MNASAFAFVFVSASVWQTSMPASYNVVGHLLCQIETVYVQQLFYTIACYTLCLLYYQYECEQYIVLIGTF